MKQIHETVAVSLSRQNLSNLLQNHQAGAIVVLSQANSSVNLPFVRSTHIQHGRLILHSSMAHSYCCGSKASQFLHAFSKMWRLAVFQGNIQTEQEDLTQIYIYM